MRKKGEYHIKVDASRDNGLLLSTANKTKCYTYPQSQS